MSKKTVSVIIVVWNAQAYVLECLETLLTHAAGRPLEIIAVDNASSDGTPAVIEERFPTVRVIRNCKNLGFAKANNMGIRESTGDYVCLLNSDVKLMDDCFSPMIRFMESHPDVGILGPQMIDPTLQIARSTMRFPTLWNTLTRYTGVDLLFPKPRSSGTLLNSDFDHRETRDVEVLNGWFWMVRRSALHKVGLLDERFFMYGEDLDWCYRFQKAGQRVVFFAGAKAFHYGGASTASSPRFFAFQMERANLQLFGKHYGLLSRSAFWLICLLGNFMRAARYGTVWLFKPSARKNVLPKYQRRIACVWWLIRGGP